MKSRFDIRRPLSLLLLGLTTTSLTVGALAADTPKRKPGLWEISTHMEGMPSMGAIQQCIDKNTDNLMQQHARKEKPDCSVMDVKQQGNKFTMHSVCKFENTTATTDAVFTGAFESAYKGDMHTRYSPPMQGMSESKMSMEAKWLGPCKAGQKPGDVIMPNMKGINMNEMMNDPKFQEMMKRQK
ncbi:MAG: DUF3617 domain-containing protein [Sulfuricella denitrificans]|nr:DUF3617 domain-containing protein [Sulfuricella denitrificans]